MSLPLPNAKKQYFDQNGNPLAGGFVNFYQPGTLTRVNTYQDPSLTIPNSNPVTLDANGQCVAWIADGTSVREIVTDYLGNQVWDQVAAIGYGSGISQAGGSSLVGFIQADVNAVLRTAQDKMRDIVSVKDFGAKGDGINDDTAAISAAFTYAASLTTSCCVYFPFGTYLISAGFTLPANVSVRGDGRGSSAIQVNANSLTVFSRINSVEANANITISGLTIQSSKTGTVGIKFTLCDETSISCVTFAGCAQNIVIDRGKVHNVTDVIVTGFSTNPMGSFRIWSSVDTDYVYFVNMRGVLFYNSSTGANTASDPAMLYVRRGVSCYFHHFSANDLIDGTTGNPTFIMLENDSQGCKFSDMIGVYCYIGVVVQQGAGVAVVPNANEFDNVDIDQPTNTAISIIAAKYLTWNGGMITARGGFQGINPIVLGSGASYLTFNGMTVSGFNSGSAGSGFFFNGATYVLVSGCVIDQAFNAFVFSAGNHQRIFNCILTNCTNKYSGSYNTAGNYYANNDGFNPLSISGPTLPATGTIVTNTLGVACSVQIFGGTVAGININGTSTGLTGGSFLINPGDTIQVFYSAAPSWTWIGH